MKNGFTLIELLVAITVVTLASAIAVPALLDSAEKPLDVASNSIVRLLQEARAQSASSGTVVSVAIDPAGMRYWILDAQARPVLTDTLSIPPEIMIATSSPRLRFRFNTIGISTGDTIRLKSPDESRAITIDTWSGDTHVR